MLLLHCSNAGKRLYLFKYANVLNFRYSLCQNFLGNAKSAKSTKISKYKLTPWARLKCFMADSWRKHFFSTLS